MPLQRLCKYPLLLKEIQKTGNLENNKLQLALDQIRIVVDDVNTRVREVENLVKLISITNQLANGGVSKYYLKFSSTCFANLLKQWQIIDPMREYLMEGELGISGKKKYVFLFNDSLLFCNIQLDENEKRVLNANRMLFLNTIQLQDLQSTNSKFK